MSLSRRPARFKRPEFKEPKPVSLETLQVLRAAAARVYVSNINDPAEKSSVQEVNNVAAGNKNVKVDEAECENEVKLLASVAIGVGKMAKAKEELDVGKKTG